MQIRDVYSLDMFFNFFFNAKLVTIFYIKVC
jgi:hypothetical protein